MNYLVILKVLFFTKLYQSTFLLILYKFWKSVIRIYNNTTELSRICVSSAKELGLSTEFDEVEEDLGSGSESDEGCEGDRIPMLPRIASFSSVSSEEFSIPVESVYRVGK
nr:614_t:CDS:1 [Entrophospora candida]